MPLTKLAKRTKNIEQFIQAILRFPHFYLRSEAEKRMTKKDLRDFYAEQNNG